MTVLDDPREFDDTWNGRRLTLSERFWRKVNKSHPSGCWVWIGATDRKGYGVLSVDNRMVFAHRLAFELLNGPIPDGHNVLHRCDNPPCVLHLFTGTQADNMADMAAKGRAASGGRNAAARLTAGQVASIRERNAAGVSQVALGREYGVSNSTIGLVVRGRTWAAAS